MNKNLKLRRLLDEEKIEYMKRQFEQEQENWRKEIGRSLDDLSSLQEEKYFFGDFSVGDFFLMDVI